MSYLCQTFQLKSSYSKSERIDVDVLVLNINMALIQCRYKYIKYLNYLLLCVWVTGFILLNLDENSITLMRFFERARRINAETVARLMEEPGGAFVLSNKSLLTPLQQFYAVKSNAFHFYELPKRKHFTTFTEITSANRDTRFPLAPDFTFHIAYNDSHVTLYEDYGSGCVFRIYLYPPLPTNADVLYRMTASDLAMLFLIMVIDGVTFRYSLEQIMIGKVAPFLFPLNTQHPTPASGIGAYTPFCYQDSLIIFYEHNKKFPDNLFQLTVNCTSNELVCPVKLYSSISRHKYVHGTKIPAFTGKKSQLDNLSNVAKLFESPESRGPDVGKMCKLECAELCPGCQRVIFHRIFSSGVISSLKFRVFEQNLDRTFGRMLLDWNAIFLSGYFDGKDYAQLDRIPLGSLFGATGSLNDYRGAAFGRRSKWCRYSDSEMNHLPEIAMTGYFYMPMPYWESALLVLEGSKSFEYPITVCYQVTKVRNSYNEKETGYLHARQTYYSDDVSGWRNVLNVSDGWGHVVALTMEIDNLRAIRNVPLSYRWAVLQADNVIYIDDSWSPTVMGTGLEDYFSYAHGFTMAENTTYAFVGVYHSSPRRTEPLTWHCYRQHILDPIPFHDSIRFVMEGTADDDFMKPVKSLTFEEHADRKLDELPTISHLIFYYFRPQVKRRRSEICDTLSFCNVFSEGRHGYRLITRSLDSGRKFTVNDTRYVGDSANDRRVTTCGRIFNIGDSFQMIMNSVDRLESFVLRRTYHSLVYEWNSKAAIEINGVDHGVWFIPMGAMSTEYSICQEDLALQIEVGKMDRMEINITIRPLSLWRDISYELCPV